MLYKSFGLALIVVAGSYGCKPVTSPPPVPRSSPTDSSQTFAQIQQFFRFHGTELTGLKHVVSWQRLTQLDSKGVKVEETGYNVSRPDLASHNEWAFSWPSLKSGVVDITEYGTSLMVMLKPSGTFRYYDYQARGWRKGPSPRAEFSFDKKLDAKNFWTLLVKAANENGGKVDAGNLVVRNRLAPWKPSKRTVAWVKWFEKNKDSLSKRLDKDMPLEQPPSTPSH